MWTNGSGFFYYGDCQQGDREATAEELAAWESARTKASRPQSVSRFQARTALLNAGLLEQVNSLMANPATPTIAKLAWADAQEFRRTSPTVLAMGAALGLTEQNLDELFMAASVIEA